MATCSSTRRVLSSADYQAFSSGCPRQSPVSYVGPERSNDDQTNSEGIAGKMGQKLLIHNRCTGISNELLYNRSSAWVCRHCVGGRIGTTFDN